ncbi:MAG TPA: HipA domain-containing protein [Myxococcota bacterium]|nr:HipA domain-containing protein [Myxococcota bacterium]
MNRCPLTYELCGERKYSIRGLKLLSPKLTDLEDFQYTKDEQIEQAAMHASKISIQGIQPKLSVRLDIAKRRFDIVDRRGTFIVKPPHLIYPEMVENEDVSMRLAAAADIDVPVHGMIYARDGSLSYIIRRFDRFGHGQKLAVEDFAQLSGHSRDTKYNSSMEQVAAVIDRFCTFPQLEKLKLFRLTIFSFLVGNEDLHLKNFSLLVKDNKVGLSPAYDLVNSSIVFQAKEQMALPIMGKKANLSRSILFDYYGAQRLKLPQSAVAKEDARFQHILPRFEAILNESFLSAKMRNAYFALLHERHSCLFSKVST